MRDAVGRICRAESEASDALRPPEFTTFSTYPVTDNDRHATERIIEAFKAQFGDHAYETKPAGASDDCSVFGRTWNVHVRVLARRWNGVSISFGTWSRTSDHADTALHKLGLSAEVEL